MLALAGLFRRLWKEEEAEVAIEYGLLVALIALALIAVFTAFNKELSAFFARVTERIAGCPEPGAEGSGGCK